MSTSILTLETPASCRVCMLQNKQKIACIATPAHNAVPFTGKPAWCPLAPLPDEDATDYDNKALNAHRDGWNHYRAEILKGGTNG